MSRFPQLNETFVLQEIVELEKLGFDVHVYPLLRERAAVQHPEVDDVLRKTRYQPFISPAIAWSNITSFLRHPVRYLRMLTEVVTGTFGSLNFFFGTLGILPKTVRAAAEMERLGVSHVHAHFANHPALAALIIHRLTGIPYSFTAHGSDLHKDQRMLDRKVSASKFTVTISQYNRQFIIDHTRPNLADKIRVVHCGIDPSRFAPRTGQREPGAIRIVCVAAFRRVKGHHILVEAARLLAERGVDFQCHLIGDGPRVDEIRRQIRDAKLESRFTLHGPKPGPQVAEWFRRADIAVLPSIMTASGQREGIPVALMEAMASAVPVVSSNQSGIPELVKDGVSGFLTPTADAAALAEALMRLATDADLRLRLGQAGREKVLRDFDLKAQSRAIAALIADSIAGGGE